MYQISLAIAEKKSGTENWKWQMDAQMVDKQPDRQTDRQGDKRKLIIPSSFAGRGLKIQNCLLLITALIILDKIIHSWKNVKLQDF